MDDQFIIYELVNDLSMEVRNFTRSRSGKTWNFSCEVCGDSVTDRKKARFGITIKSAGAVTHCFNCGYTAPFKMYLKEYHPHLYEKMIGERVKTITNPLYDLNPLFSSLDDLTLAGIFYITTTPNIKYWMNTLENKKVKLKRENLERLVQIHRATHKK